MKSEYFECDCDSIEHIFRVSYITDEPDEMYFEPHLKTSENFFNRVVIAVKYIFGHRSIYGDFDAVILNVLKISKLYKYLGEFLKENERYENTQQEHKSSKTI